jgi:hypothetical protein
VLGDVFGLWPLPDGSELESLWAGVFAKHEAPFPADRSGTTY